jgi:hypothetical protein
VYALQGAQLSRTNGRGLITVAHARRPADRIASLLPTQTLAVRPRPRVLISSAPPGSLELLAARDRGSRHRDGRSSGGPGGSRGVVPPVPFPNTVVKRPSANDTAWATAWDNRPVPGPPLTPCCSACYSDRSAQCAWLPERRTGEVARSTLTIEEWWGA